MSNRTQLRLQNSATGVLAAAVLAMIAYGTARHPVQWDWTMDSRHTLEEQSVKAALSFPDGLSATVYVQESTDLRKQAEELLEKYRLANPALTVRYVDPDLDPTAARKEEITTYGTILLRTKEKSEKVTELSEEQVTNALVRLSKGEKKSIRFLAGHGEHPLAAAEEAGPPATRKGDRLAYTQAAELLKGEGYAVAPLILASEEAVPEDTSVLVVAGPRKPLLPIEVERIKKWYDAGNGRLLVMSDPDTDSGLEPMLKEQGITFLEGTIIDLTARLLGASPTTPLITRFDSHHPATQGMKTSAVFMEARGLQVEPPAGGGKIKRTELLHGAERGWLETGSLAAGTAAFDQGKDLQGPILMGAAVEDDKKRLVALGDSDFISDTYAGQLGNIDLFLNTVRWLAQDENFIAIKPKPVMDAGLALQQGTAILLLAGLVGVIPVTLATTGLVIWSRRKRR